MSGDNLEMLLLVLFLGPIAIALAYLTLRPRIKERKYKRLLHSWLLDKQFEEIDKNGNELREVIKQNPLLKRGFGKTSVRKAYMSRMDWGIVWLADYYSYSKQQGSTSAGPTRQHVCIVSNPDLDLPEMSIRPSQRMTKMVVKFADMLVKSIQKDDQDFDVKFADDPSFSEAYHVFSRDEQSARQLLSSVIRKFMVDLRPLNLSFGCFGQSFAFHYGRYIEPDLAVKMMNQANIFLNLFRGETSQAEMSIGRGEHLVE